MLVQFSVENFLSIKDKVIFKLLASADKEIKENLIEKENENYLKSAVIYGANASGKSNFIKAINIVKIMLINSNNMQPGMKLPIIPFKFDKEYIRKPSKFEFVMLINNIKYVYGFVADSDRIYSEYLYYYPNGRETKIFERTEGENYNATATESSIKEIAKRNMENKFFLATATTWNYEKTKPVYEYITKEIIILFDYDELRPMAFNQYYNDKDGILKEFSLNIFKDINLNINDYLVSNIEIPEEHLLMFPPEVRAFLPKGAKAFNVTTSHNIINEDGCFQSVKLDFEEESLGTQNIFLLTPILLDVLKKGKTLIVDELDKSLHPVLVKYIINLFNSDKYNKNGAQLIFNTHDTNFLNLSLFRRDQIWFTEKNNKSDSTDLYSLCDFSVRKTENIQKGYLSGKYGGIPFIAVGDNMLSEE